MATETVLTLAIKSKSSSQVCDCKLKAFAKTHSAEFINILFLKKLVTHQ